MTTTTLKVGALAKRTGLTVRTLHHYDEIGLLSPSERTPSGHRLYGEEELRRLQQIAALKQLGLPLDEIRECLERPEYSLEHVLELQIERIEGEIGRQRRLRGVLTELRDQVRAGSRPSLDELAQAVEATVSYDRHFSAEQLEELRARRTHLGEERIYAAQEEWARLFRAFGEAMKAGVSPDATEVQRLARRSAELIREFTGGDPEMSRSLATMYREEGPERTLSRHGMELPDGLWEYMAAARGALVGG